MALHENQMRTLQTNMDHITDVNSQVTRENLQQKNDLVETRQMLIERIEETKFEFSKKLSENNVRITYNNEKITELNKSIAENSIRISDIREQVKINT